MLTRRGMGALCISLVMGLLVAAGGGWAAGQVGAARRLADDTLRLHIRADTDAVGDQSAKLAVRDAVLAFADAHCPAGGKAEARSWAAENLVQLELTARQALAARGIHAPVKAALVNMYFSTRRYDGAALPAGRYDAVRLDIGTRRAGRNWWCVLYPGLCRSACGGYALPEENDLVCGEYILRFRLAEWWAEAAAPRGDVLLAGGTRAPAAA